MKREHVYEGVLFFGNTPPDILNAVKDFDVRHGYRNSREFKDKVLNEVGLDLANSMPSPRVIKSHLPVKLMSRQIKTRHCKTVVLFRNPKDLFVSYYHFYRASSSSVTSAELGKTSSTCLGRSGRDYRTLPVQQYANQPDDEPFRCLLHKIGSEIGDWKNLFTVKQSDLFEKFYKDEQMSVKPIISIFDGILQNNGQRIPSSGILEDT
ncbi:ST1C2-like protein [Mya arenaria]|uniref:ST1C2-like protein n=1 Tax=Mya arenaria TaxID=6604 RepID=A0ABY7FAJ6_MYAAR|nr:ST1C2-like protein [Mya arenaria]